MSRRSMLLLAGGVVLAGFGVMTAAGRGTSAEIGGQVLDPRAEPVETIVAATPVPPPPPPTVDLDHITLVGDHYEAPRSDGTQVTLTLDPELQAAAEKLLADAKVPRGAIVAMAPDGRILALAGRKTEGTKGQDVPNDPHLALDVWAPAASVFKLVTASALVAGGMDPDDKVCFHGGVRSVVESNLRDDKRDNNCQSLLFGVAHSNNAILGKLAFQHLEPTVLEKQARSLGLDRPLDLGANLGARKPISAGHLAMPAAHDLTFAQTAAGFTSWTEASGKGEAAPATPWGAQLSAVGGAMLAATFADDGDQPTPYLVAGPAPKAQHVLDREVARKVGRMMVAACDFGSASRSFGKHSKVHAAGKTGTLTQEGKGTDYTQYSWFVGYAPVEKPEIVVSVVLGNPESWQMKGHEVGQKLIDHATRHEDDHGAKHPTRQRTSRSGLQW